MQAYTTPPPPPPHTTRAQVLQSLSTRMQARQVAKLTHLKLAQQTWQHQLDTLRLGHTGPETPTPTPPLPPTHTAQLYSQRMATYNHIVHPDPDPDPTPTPTPALHTTPTITKPTTSPVTTVPVAAPAPAVMPVNVAAVQPMPQPEPQQELQTGVERPNLVLYLRRLFGQWIHAIQRDDRVGRERVDEREGEPHGAQALGAAAQALVVILSAGMGRQ